MNSQSDSSLSSCASTEPFSIQEVFLGSADVFKLTGSFLGTEQATGGSFLSWFF